MLRIQDVDLIVRRRPACIRWPYVACPQRMHLLVDRRSKCRLPSGSPLCMLTRVSAPVRPRRTQVERRQESERALLTAAAEIIGERGITGASLATISERAGTSRGLPTHHFGTKDALVSQVAKSAQDRVVAETVAALERAHRDINDLSALELVRATVDTYLEMFEKPSADERALIVMWGATFPSESSVDGMVEADQRAYDGWAELIAQGQVDGSIRSDVDPNVAAVVLQALIRGMAAILLTKADRTHALRGRQTVNQWLGAALAPSPSE
jgi:AcrR family transcriptional regulator